MLQGVAWSPELCHNTTVPKGDPIMFIYEVTGNYHGRTVKEEVKAANQSEARRRFNIIYPEYRPGAAKNIGRA